MVIVSGIVLILALIWLSRPPRDSDRRALLAGVVLTAAWFVLAGVTYGVPPTVSAWQFRWLVVLALVGAPLVVLFVWSAVTLVTRPRAASDDAGERS